MIFSKYFLRCAVLYKNEQSSRSAICGRNIGLKAPLARVRIKQLLLIIYGNRKNSSYID